MNSVDTLKENATSFIDRIIGPLTEAKIPFSTTQGVLGSCHREITVVDVV